MESDKHRFDKLRFDVIDFLILNQKEQLKALREATNELHDVALSLSMIVDRLEELLDTESDKNHRTSVLLKFYEPL